jgi:predicted nuclease of predicted toxin-antitoxin system
MSLALYLDHHIDRRISEGLRRRGCDVLTAREDRYDQRPDADLLARATNLGRVVVTFDEDFLAIAADWQASGQPFAGLIYGRARDLSVGDAVLDLELISQAVLPSEIENSVVWIPL